MASHNRPPITCPPFPEGFEPGYTSGQAGAIRRGPPALLPLGLSGGSGDGRQPGDWECPECGEIFVRDTELQSHMKADHDIEMVLLPSATSLKQETSAAEEEEEEVNKNPAAAAATEEQELNSAGERGSRGKKRKRGRWREESGGERRGEEAAAEVHHELAETEEAMGGGGGGGEAKLPGNYYCDAPVCLILQYPHT
jgi:hypothetical protein